jgi:protein-disulfide isomerase
MGRTAGMTDEQVNACLQDGDMARALVAVYQQNAEADGIESTPSFVINGEKYSNMSYEEFSAILDEKLGS